MRSASLLPLDKFKGYLLLKLNILLGLPLISHLKFLLTSSKEMCDVPLNPELDDLLLFLPT